MVRTFNLGGEGAGFGALILEWSVKSLQNPFIWHRPCWATRESADSARYLVLIGEFCPAQGHLAHPQSPALCLACSTCRTKPTYPTSKRLPPCLRATEPQSTEQSRKQIPWACAIALTRPLKPYCLLKMIRWCAHWRDTFSSSWVTTCWRLETDARRWKSARA